MFDSSDVVEKLSVTEQQVKTKAQTKILCVNKKVDK